MKIAIVTALIVFIAAVSAAVPPGTPATSKVVDSRFGIQAGVRALTVGHDIKIASRAKARRCQCIFAERIGNKWKIYSRYSNCSNCKGFPNCHV